MPGHGDVCDKGYLDEQGSFILEWKEYVRDAVNRGMSRDEAVASLTRFDRPVPNGRGAGRPRSDGHAH